MSRGINKVILIGHIGQEIEIRQMPNGNAVANISLATSDSWKDRETGQQHERTEWHRVVLFGRLAEIAQQYARKGSKIYIEGRLQTREWEKDGVKRYTTEIVVDMRGQMQLLDSRPDGQQQQYQQQAPASQPQQQHQQHQQHNERPPAQHTPAPQNQASQGYAQAKGGTRQARQQASGNGNAPGYNPYNANQPAPQPQQQRPAPAAQMPPEYANFDDDDLPF